MAKQIKDFISFEHAKTQLSVELVETVARDLVKWIYNTLMGGYEVRLESIGKFCIGPNTYSHSGILLNRKNGHYHEFSPKFRFTPNFKVEVDKNANSIRVGWQDREKKRLARKAQKQANNQND